MAAVIPVHRPAIEAVEERQQRVVVGLRDRVEFVVVTNRTLGRQSEHHGAHRVGAVDTVPREDFVVDRPVFVGGDVQPVESRGDAVAVGGAGQQVAGELPGDELVVGQVVVDRVDDPVAVGPHLAVIIQVQSVGVGVADQVQPVPTDVLSELRCIEKFVDDALVSVRVGVGEVTVDHVAPGRQSGEVQMHPAEQ